MTARAAVTRTHATGARVRLASLGRRGGRSAVAALPEPARRRLFGARFAPARANFDRTPFSFLERPDGSRVPLWNGYRKSVRGWIYGLWPTATLFELSRRVRLPEEAERFRASLVEPRTMPVPQREAVTILRSLRELHPDAFVEGDIDPAVGERRLALRPQPAAVAARQEQYRRMARRILQRLRAYGLHAPRAAVLEVGCNIGHLTAAIASAGVARSVGVDIELDLDRRLEREALVSLPDVGDVELMYADAHHLPFDDEFDVVVSVSVLEHVTDVRRALAETARVLRPGGLAYHTVNGWFSPDGGHSLCTLDFPWGHVRLTAPEFEQYVEAHRPHEAASARALYARAFQQPRVPMRELREAAERAGFAVDELETSRWRFRAHRELLDDVTLADCRRTHPTVTRRDLLTDTYVVVLRRVRS